MTDIKKAIPTRAGAAQLTNASTTYKTEPSTIQALRPAKHIEIACDNLLLLGTEGLSKTGAHALFSDGAFNTTVSKIHKCHGIFLARETRTKINKRGVATHPMFYWIEDKTMAYQVVKLTNHLKQQRGAAPQTLNEVEKFMANFPDEASTNRNLNKEAS